MIKNYILIAFRNLYRNSFYSSINIVGLAIGIACSIMILLWVADELSFNSFHKNYDRIYKVRLNQEYQGQITTSNTVPYPLKEMVKSKSTDIKHITITNFGEGNMLSTGDHGLNKLGLAATEDFFKMFSFDLVQGNPATALADVPSIVLTESTAKALFGDRDPLNQEVKFDNKHVLKVTGVMKNFPAQSSFQFDYIIPFAFYETTQEWVRNSRENWRNNSFQMYVELNDGASEEKVNETIQYLVRDNNTDMATAKLFLHPMKYWRLYSEFQNGKMSGGMIQYVRLFTVIAIFIIAIACINFMNLATARSERRAREVGIRKSVGSGRKQLIAQFLGESILITCIGFVLALTIVELSLPVYNTLVGKKLMIDYANPFLWMGALAIILITGTLAGSYPAFYLSGFKPVNVLKGKVITSHGASSLRKVMVTSQFAISIFLMIGTLVIYQQIMHVKNRETGYDRENLMLIWTNPEIEGSYRTIKEELLRSGVVTSVSKSSAPVTSIFSSADVDWPGKDPNMKAGFATVATEYDYIKTLGMKLLQGRDFSEEFAVADSSSVIINRAAVEMMGLDNPIGAKLTMWGDEWSVIGVTENVIMASPYAPVEPLIVAFNPGWSSTINVRVAKSEDLAGAVSKVEGVFKKLTPSFPLWYRFADTAFEAKFSSINLISRLAGIFAILAVFITGLGLFGLAAFTAEQRRKELGIRKVLGATVSGLILLISRDFSRLILVAFVIAAPLAWLALNNFLEQYPYRVTIAWWILPAAGITALTVAMIIVGTQALRAALNNPVDSLRDE